MIRVAEPVVHVERPYTRAMWRLEVKFKFLRRSLLGRCRRGPWEELTYRDHPLMGLVSRVRP